MLIETPFMRYGKGGYIGVTLNTETVKKNGPLMY